MKPRQTLALFSAAVGLVACPCAFAAGGEPDPRFGKADVAAARSTTLHLIATVYDVHTSKGVSSSKEKVYEGSTKLGEDSSSCTERTPSTLHCTGSYRLTRGTILFSGTISNSGNANRLTITGGTGAYKSARGTILTEYNRAGTRAKETITFNESRVT